VLREPEAGAKIGDLARKHGISEDAVQLEGQVRRHGRSRREAAEAARGGECEAEKASLIPVETGFTFSSSPLAINNIKNIPLYAMGNECLLTLFLRAR
jgi:hypothetical protein